MTDLGDKSAELDKVRAELQETTCQLRVTETKLNSTEKNLARCQVTESGEMLEETKNPSVTEGKFKASLSGHN